MADWQFVQIVDAIQNLLMTAKAPVAGAGASRCLAGALRSTTRKGPRIDNNAAERLVRPVKVKLKVIGGFRAVSGAEAFCILRSVWETSKLNGQNPFEVLREAFTPQPE